MNDSKPNSPPIAVLIDPRKGMMLHDACNWYGNQERARPYNVWRTLAHIPAGKEDALTPEQQNELANYGTALREDLVMMLARGDLVAKGFCSGRLGMVDIPSEWWWEAIVDIDQNAAEAHGTKISGVMVFPGLKTTPTRSTAAPKRHSSAAAQREFDEWVAGLPVRPTKRQTEDWARAHGYPITVARALFIAQNKRSRGRPSKA